MAIKTGFIVTACDPYGAPRAHGIAPTKWEARMECERQLGAYCADPVREFRSFSDYTFKTEDFISEGGA